MALNVLPVENNISLTHGNSLTFGVPVFADDDKTIPFDLSNSTAKMQVRGRITDATPVLTLQVGSGLSIANNVVFVAISSAESTLLPPNKPCIYSLRIDRDDGLRRDLIAGTITATSEVTQ